MVSFKTSDSSCVYTELLAIDHLELELLHTYAQKVYMLHLHSSLKWYFRCPTVAPLNLGGLI